ncbi:C4-dicarboxylic acid transporter DauA [Candidatus Venteria ishoeyi]|uniref:C4-dicarboxylic acid transporter DauA n=1 Tax=Candidatus Venteria ishoeyi TaxID=1899563 RepID=A0A1H6F2A5_9GAMM|nr:C4-dicarboxylic acid transporter DauA [Candidatus Venteria ishoeyi]
MFFNFNCSDHGCPKNDLLSGLTVALALVPEAVAFAFVAGVDPLVGLYAAFIVGLITAVIGGRPGMISGATGAF